MEPAARHAPPSNRRAGRSAAGTATRVFIAVLCSLAVLGPLAAPAAAVGPGDPPPSSVPESASEPAPGHKVTGAAPLIVIGIGGLTWEDISPSTSPNIWRLAEHSAKGNLSVRTIRSATCAIDGWLTIGAGRRAGTEVDPDGDVRCPPMPDVTGRNETRRSGPSRATVDGFSDYRTFNAGQAYDAVPGSLSSALRKADCTAAIGPGAAVALADKSGDVDRYRPIGTVPPKQGPHRLGTCDLTMIDLGSIGDSSWLNGFDTTSRSAGDSQADNTVPDAAALGGEEERKRLSAAVEATQLKDADELLGRYLQAIPDHATVMLLGLADSSPSPRLGTVMISGPKGSHGLLTSDSTRRTGLMQITDVAPTVLGLLGNDRDPGFVGTEAVYVHADASESGPGAEAGTTRDVKTLRSNALASHLVHDSVGTFSIWLDLAYFVFFALLALGLFIGRRSAARRRAARSYRRARTASWVALALGCVPTATFLPNLVPWAAGPHPLALLAAGIGVGTALLVALTMVPPWGRTWLGRVGALGLVTTAILGIDAATGSHLQLNSLLGYNAIVGGRFYGLGNLAAALYIVGALMGTSALASPLLAAGRRRTAAALAIVIGVAVIVVFGNPAWGAKFGGTIAAIAGFAVLVLLVIGVRISLRRLVGVAVIALVVLLAVAGLDYLRPADERSHFGLFFQHLLSGSAPDIIVRKLEANLSILLINPLLSALVPAGIVMIGLVLRWATRWQRTRPWAERFAGRLPEAADRRPALTLGLAATMMGLAVGLVITDSGAAVPGTGFMLLIPMLVMAGADVLPSEEQRS